MSYATQEAIERFDAAIIVSNAMEVDASELDANGSYDAQRLRPQTVHFARSD